MSDESAGLEPGDVPMAEDAALNALMSQWVADAPDSIDVEAALARVNVRRRSERPDVQDDLAVRRTRRAAVPVHRAALWQRPAFRAAATLLVVAGAAGLWLSKRATPALEETYVTAMGSAKEIRLSDGTDVRLGPASSLVLQPGFGREHRRLTLRGEAWFKVTHDASRPFSIRVGTTTVEDVGTAFLVRETPSSGVSVRVAEGAVRVTTSAATRDSTVLLHGGDGALATPTGITVAAAQVTANESEAMAAGHLTFTDASMSEVQVALRRWYGVSMVMADSGLSTRHVTADFTGEPLSRVASVLGLSLGVSASVHGDTIELHSAPGVLPRR